MPINLLGNYSKLAWMILFFMTTALFSGAIATYYSQPLNKKLRIYLSRLRAVTAMTELTPVRY
jgi:hypothetical protein